MKIKYYKDHVGRVYTAIGKVGCFNDSICEDCSHQKNRFRLILTCLDKTKDGVYGREPCGYYFKEITAEEYLVSKL
jgi:hypothetical protein